MFTYPAAAALAAVASLLIGKQEKGLSERAVRAATWAGFAMGGKFVLNTLSRPIGAITTLGDYQPCVQDPETGAFVMFKDEESAREALGLYPWET